MEKTVTLNGKSLSYELVHSKRTQRISIMIFPAGKIVIKVPIGYVEKRLHDFLSSKADWIVRQHALMEKKVPGLKIGGGKRHYAEHKEEARSVIVTRVIELNKQYGFSYKSISIKNQASRWGSCSRTGNLNFNYRLLFVEPELRDYVIIHELCHLKEHNHAPKFWALVAEGDPQYRLHRKALKRYTF